MSINYLLINQWKSKLIIKSDNENLFKKLKGIDNISSIIKKSSIINNGNEFLDYLNKTINSRIYKNALSKIIDNYFNKERNILRNYINKWKEQYNKIEKKNLITKLIISLCNRNDMKYRKLKLSQFFNKWSSNIQKEKILEDKIFDSNKKNEEKKNSALLIRTIKRYIDKNNNNNILKTFINRWLNKINDEKEKNKQNILKGINLLKKYNSTLNSNELINKLKEIIIESLKNEKLERLKKLIKKNINNEKIILLINLYKWKSNLKEEKKELNTISYKQRYLKNIITKKDKNKIIRAIFKWKSNLKPKENNITKKIGLNIINKILLKGPFNKIKETKSKKPFIIPKDLTLREALLKGNIISAKSLALKNIPLFHYFLKWKNIIEKENKLKEKIDIFNKIILNAINKINEKKKRKFFNRWKDTIIKNGINQLEKNIYMKLMKNISNKFIKNILINKLNQWKNQTDKISNKIKDTIKGLENLRRIITNPIFEKVKIKEGKIPINSKIKSLIINKNLSNKRNNLNKFLFKWKKILNNEKENKLKNKVKTTLLSFIIKQQNLKTQNYLKNTLKDNLLKWRKNTTKKDNTLEKISKIRKGLEILIKALRKPNNNSVYKGIKKRKKVITIKKIITKIIYQEIPKIKKNITKKYLDDWKNKIPNKEDEIKKFKNFFDTLLQNSKLKSKRIQPYKDLKTILKEILKNKNEKAQKLINFFKRIKRKQSKQKIENRNHKLKNLLIKKDNKMDLLKYYFMKLRRIIKKKKAIDQALIIKKFCKVMIKKVNKKRNNINNLVNIIKKSLIMKIFNKLVTVSKNKNISKSLIKILNNYEKGNKKILKNILLKWKNIIPLLRRNNYVIKIQSVYRGMKTRKNQRRLKDKLIKLKQLYNRINNSRPNLLRYYIMKWNQKIHKDKCISNIQKIQKFMKNISNKNNTKKSKIKLKELLKKYYLKKVRNVLIKLHPVNKKEYNQLIFILDKLSKKRRKNAIGQIKKYIKINKLKNIYQKIINALKKYFLPLYLRKWKTISIDERDKKIKKIQNYLKNKFTNKKTKLKQKINYLLKLLINKKNGNNNLKLKRYLYKWIKNARTISLKLNAEIIHKFCKQKLNKKLKKKINSQLFIGILLRNYLIREIMKILNQSNDYIKNIKEGLNNIKGVDKRYSINNILNYANDLIKNKLLWNILNKLNKSDKDNLLKKNIEKWKRVSEQLNLKAFTIQNFINKIKIKKKKKNKEKIKDILLRIFLKNDNKNNKLIYYLRNWMLIIKKLGCKINSEKIRNFLLKKYKNKLKNNTKKFFIKLIKSLLSQKLKDIVRIIKLKNSITKYIFKKTIKNINKHGKKNKIISILKKRILLSNTNLKTNLLKKYINLWNIKTKEIKNKENKYSSIIQKFIKKIKDKSNKLKSSRKLFLLKKIILNLKRKNPLRVNFNKYRTNIKKIELQENADIIKKFCKIVKKRRDKEKFNKARNNIIKAFDILSKLNPNKKYAFEKIKIIKRSQILNQLFDYLNKKRNDNLKKIFVQMKKYKNKNKVMKIITIRKKLINKKLFKALKKWFEQIKIIKQRIENDKNKKDRIKNLLNLFINKKTNDNNNKKRTILFKLLNKVKRKNANDKIKKIQKYLIKKNKIKNNKKLWEKITKLLSLKNKKTSFKEIINKLNSYIKLKKKITILNKKFKSYVFKRLLNNIKYKKLLSLMKNLIVKSNSKNNNHILKKYLIKWNDIIKKLKSKNEVLEKMIKTIDKREKIISFNIIINAILIKKLLHDIIKIRALDFIKKLKKNFESKKRIRALGDSLIKTKENFKFQNKRNFIINLYKIFYMKTIQKMFNKIIEKSNKKKISYMKLFFYLLKIIKNKKSEIKYSSKHQGTNDNKKINLKLQFRAHISSPQSLILKKRNIFNYIIPLFIDYLNKKIFERKKLSFNQIKVKYKNNKFIQLMKNYIMKRQIKNKKDFLNKLLSLFNQFKYKNSIYKIFKILFKKYFFYLIKKQIKTQLKVYKIIYLLKMTFMHKGISKKRFIRELLRKWRFISFVKIMAKKKLELMYKNLHISYLQMANEIFGEDNYNSNNSSVIKEFERFGNDIGLFENENYIVSQESSFCKKIKKKYIFDTLDTDNIKLMEDYYKDKSNIHMGKGVIIKKKERKSYQVIKVDKEDEKEININEKKIKTFNRRKTKDDDSENNKRTYKIKRYEKK